MPRSWQWHRPHFTTFSGEPLQSCHSRLTPQGSMLSLNVRSCPQAVLKWSGRETSTRCQYQQCFTSRFYAQRSQKCKKTWLNFCAFGICECRSCTLNVDEIGPRSHWWSVSQVRRVPGWSHPFTVRTNRPEPKSSKTTYPNASALSPGITSQKK